MKRAGQVVVIKFPQTDFQGNKLRPSLLIAPLHGKYGDWLVCMISTQINQAIDNFDEIVYEDSIDFVCSGLKKASVIRISRLSIVTEDILFGTTGEISNERLHRIKQKLAKWIAGNDP